MSSDIFECRGFAECGSRCVSTDAAVPAALVRRTVLVALIQYMDSRKKERAFTKFSYFSRPCPVRFSPHARLPAPENEETASQEQRESVCEHTGAAEELKQDLPLSAADQTFSYASRGVPSCVRITPQYTNPFRRI